MSTLEHREGLPRRFKAMTEAEKAAQEEKLLQSLEQHGGVITSETDVPDAMVEAGEADSRNTLVNAIYRAARNGNAAYTIGPDTNKHIKPIVEVRSLER